MFSTLQHFDISADDDQHSQCRDDDDRIGKRADHMHPPSHPCSPAVKPRTMPINMPMVAAIRPMRNERGAPTSIRPPACRDRCFRCPAGDPNWDAKARVGCRAHFLPACWSGLLRPRRLRWLLRPLSGLPPVIEPPDAVSPAACRLERVAAGHRTPRCCRGRAAGWRNGLPP
jgi:hypothetical protein